MIILLSLKTSLPLSENQKSFSCPAKSNIPKLEFNKEYTLEFTPLEGGNGFSKRVKGSPFSKYISFIVVLPTPGGPTNINFLSLIVSSPLHNY